MADYGLLGGLAEGLKQGLQGYQTERNYQDEKRKQLAQQMMQKQLLQSSLLDKNQQIQDNGQVSLNDLGQKQKELQGTKTAFETDEYSPGSDMAQRQAAATNKVLGGVSSDLSETVSGDTSVAEQNALAKGLVGEGIKTIGTIKAGHEKFSPIVEQRREVMENGIHQKVLTRLNGDTNLKSRLQQYQNLTNILQTADNVQQTPESIQELQQAVRSNLGIKGQSGVGERDETYMKSLGLNTERIKEFLTGNPADIARDNGIFKHFKALANQETGNVQKSYQARMRAVTAGNESLYARRPDLKQDLDNALGAQTEQIGMASAQALPSQQPGLVRGDANAAGPNPQPNGPSAKPGAIVNVKGQRYKIGSDGNTLEPL